MLLLGYSSRIEMWHKPEWHTTINTYHLAFTEKLLPTPELNKRIMGYIGLKNFLGRVKNKFKKTQSEIVIEIPKEDCGFPDSK